MAEVRSDMLGYNLRAGVKYQDGEGTNAPALLFAGADYSAEDQDMGLREDGKYVNEPAIVYVRYDGFRRLSEDSKWGKNALDFILSRGLKKHFEDWCGGWPCPYYERRAAFKGMDRE